MVSNFALFAVGAMGLATSLSWSNVVNQAISTYFPQKTHMRSALAHAIATTAVVMLILVVMSRAHIKVTPAEMSGPEFGEMVEPFVPARNFHGNDMHYGTV